MERERIKNRTALIILLVVLTLVAVVSAGLGALVTLLLVGR